MIAKTWIIEKLKECNFSKTEVYKYYEQFKNETGTNPDQDTFKRYVRRVYEAEVGPDLEDIDEASYVSLNASKQKLQDINNTIKKENRESYRIYNSLEEVYSEYIKVLKEVDLTKFKIKEHKEKTQGREIIVQLSDLHANELINSSESNFNSYDFEIFSKRLKKLAREIFLLGEVYKTKDVYIFMTGDLINSNRRLSEKLAMATSQVRASLLTTHLIQQFIIELSSKYNIHVSCVVGNESRIGEDVFDTSTILASENWDYLIFQNLKMMFAKTPIKFIEPTNYIQSIVTLKSGFNALLLHGHSIKSSNFERELGKVISSYILNGKKVNGVFVGHIHSAHIGDILSRSSSMCGGNAYSYNDLNVNSRASQNCYIINKDLSYNGLKIDLQNVEGIEGYDIIEELERYDVKNVKPNQMIISQNLT